MSTSSITTESLRQDILECTACTARAECTRPTPFWPRETPSPLMVVGRNPGVNEDKEGLPFVGRGGKLLEGWLRGLGITREQIWLTNTIKCYTAADRKPKPQEIKTCFSLHLKQELQYCQPHFIVPLGSEAFNLFTGLDRLTYRHGIIYDRRSTTGAYVMGAIHPGSALRSAGYMDALIEDATKLKPLLPLILSGRLAEDGFPPEVDVQ